jgi:hypothetical protein
MDARPLRELFADLVGDAEARHAYGSDPAGYLAAHGHPDLPEPLVAEAVVSYADTAPVEVAEVLAPYVTAHGPVPAAEADADPDTGSAADWFDLLTSSDVADDPFGEHPGEEPGEEPAADPDPQVGDVAGAWADPAELDFGTGAGAAAAPETEPAEAAGAEPGEEATQDQAPAEPGWTADEAFAPEPPIEGFEPEDGEPLD